jgi:hypothetical protein
MSVCGACIYKLHHFSRKRKTGGGEDCECKCVGEPARALSKQEKLRRLQIALETPTPSDHSVLSELSTRVIGLQRQVTSIRKEMLLHNPTPHQCTISPEFAFILINRMDELEKRVGQLAQEPTKAQVDPAVQEVPSQSPDKIIPLKPWVSA